jgi:arginine-tRNA-protein transferase
VTSNAGGPALYLSSEHACSYLPGRQARTLFIDPLAPMSGHLYQHLLEHGFRRSGSHVYRPACGHCHACVPLRIPVAEFRPNRSQQRAWRRTRERLSLRELPPRFDSAHFALYRRYIEARHSDGSMADASPESYEDFLLSPWGGETRLLELRLDERLMAVAVTDVLGNALSAVYTFFDPDLSAQAPGTLAVLCQASEAQRWGLDWLYLGYWIEECRKMSYKDRFRPVEAWIDGAWRPAERGAGIPWR